MWRWQREAEREPHVPDVAILVACRKLAVVKHVVKLEHGPWERCEVLNYCSRHTLFLYQIKYIHI
jgi:hypothetical protein